ncbi:MAG TPA: GNAT family N-acetyltransferase [Burkholderiaceae bacterium]|nr:GNAT family N-acetyltransferase [Burkholderiaceae bacterium]
MTAITGAKVTLRRARDTDRARIYEWLIGSDLTVNLMGPPMFPDRPIPSPEQFAQAYPAHFYDGTRPYAGRMYIIGVAGDELGCISHGPIDVLNDVVELDIWLAERRVAGHGYGSEALVTLCDWLQVNFGVNRFLARPSRRNVKALRAMRRAGFRETDLPAPEVVAKLELPAGQYGDEMLLFRILPPPSTVFRADPSQTYVFIDSEFTSLRAPQLISVGAVATDSTAFYAELEGWDRARASRFVNETVIPLLDGDAVPKELGAQALTEWLTERARRLPTTIISDSGFDRWALAELFGGEQLPPNVQWRRVPIAYESLDEATQRLNLRRHHALDDARALRHLVLEPHVPAPV